MEWIILILLILIGFILLALEFLVLPGISISGIMGFLALGGAIYTAYTSFGQMVGHLILLTISLSGFGFTFYLLRSKTWKRLQLHSQIDSSIESIDTLVQEGDVGVTLGRLAPMGKVRIGEHVVEAQSLSGYIAENSNIIVLKVFKNKIIVKLKSE